MLRNKPDPRINWDEIEYSVRSDDIRPEPGYRMCTKCGTVLAINAYNFTRNRRNPDGYSYYCRSCQRSFSPSLARGQNNPTE